METVRLGGLWDGATKHQAGSVWDKNQIAPTIDTMQGGGREPMIIDKVKQLGFMDNGTGQHQSNTVYDVNMVCPNITTVKDGGTQQIKILTEPTIVAMRGRNPDNPSDRTVGALTEQRLEPNSQGICNTLTTVQKDNLVMEQICISTKGKENEVASTILAGYERTNMTGFNADNGVIEIVKIKQATSQGYIECEVGGVADLSFPDSKTRRGRVQENGQVSPTLMAGEQDICRIEKVGQIESSFEQSGRVYNPKGISPTIMSNSHGGTTGGYIPHKITVSETMIKKVGQISNDGSQYGTVVSEDGLSPNLVAGTHGYANNCIQTQYRIRKLTPKECWRLMDFKDEDFEKVAKVNSNTQLYKQEGNSIVRNVLVAVFGQMISGKEEIYKNI